MGARASSRTNQQQMVRQNLRKALPEMVRASQQAQTSPWGMLRDQILVMEDRLVNLRLGGYSVWNRTTAMAIAGILGAMVLAKGAIYDRIGREAAEMASKTLQQKQLMTQIQQTLESVAHDPETLRILVRLVEQLVDDDRTRRALLELVVWLVRDQDTKDTLLALLQELISDPELQAGLGSLIVQALEFPQNKRSLEKQTADLVKRTVSDDEVQRSTADGVYGAVWYAVTPRFASREWWRPTPS
eukprot:TRINITY_DN23657_c0_g1_i1.p1 TRINITY_DN23657_c0_g1~~TRINITY_DN23657_c0_g1_i1.p1  ORF type:complete len:244 (+),score=69.93 TRINITY_DN23657_c0_g1_i1:3-734(+)